MAAERPEWSAERTRDIAAAHRGRRGPLLPILHALTAEYGYVDPRAVEIVAEELNLSRAEVHGVITFYRDFRTEPPGTVRVTVCRAEACQAVGAERVAAAARRHLGIDFGATTADGSVTLDEAFCLGNCALGPAAMVDGRLLGRLDEARLDTVLAEARLGAALTEPGPQP